MSVPVATQCNHRGYLFLAVHSGLSRPQRGQLGSNVNANIDPDFRVRHPEFGMLEPDGSTSNTSDTLSRHQRDDPVRLECLAAVAYRRCQPVLAVCRPY